MLYRKHKYRLILKFNIRDKRRIVVLKWTPKSSQEKKTIYDKITLNESWTSQQKVDTKNTYLNPNWILYSIGVL